MEYGSRISVQGSMLLSKVVLRMPLATLPHVLCETTLVVGCSQNLQESCWVRRCGVYVGYELEGRLAL